MSIPLYQSEQPIDCNPDFRVVAESDEWIVVSKAAPLIVHPSNGKIEPTLLEGVATLLCYEQVNGMKLALINRLDRETSGLTLLANTPGATRQLGKAMQRGLIHKGYLAIVHGHPFWDFWECREPILRQGDMMNSPIYLKQCVHPKGKPCTTEFHVLRRFEREESKFSIIQCTPKTGRTHQIRVHLAYLGYPIVGDKIYGANVSCYLEFIVSGWSPSLAARLLLPRHALHAQTLQFPYNEETIFVEDTLSSDLQAFIDG